jgi:hypothetical protein
VQHGAGKPRRSPYMPACTEWHPHHGAFIEKSHFPETPAYSYCGGKECSRLLMTAVPSVHTIYVETLGPMKR